MPLDRLGKLLGQQHSVASRGQLLALGMPDRAMQYRLRTGSWQALLPGIYLSAAEPPGFTQKEMAALLYAGPDGVVTGPAALAHHGTESPADVGVIDVLVPIRRQRLDVGFVRLHRTARMPAKPIWAGPLRLAPAPRAVADTAWQLSCLEDVRAVVADALQSGQCTASQLTAELNEGPIRGSAAFRSVLAGLAEATGSPKATAAAR